MPMPAALLRPRRTTSRIRGGRLLAAMRSPRLLHAVALAALSIVVSPVVSAAGRGDLVALEIERAAAAGGSASASRPVAVRFDALGRHFELALEPNDALIADGVQASIVDEGGRQTVAMPVAWIG